MALFDKIRQLNGTHTPTAPANTNRVRPADYITDYFDYIRLHFCREESHKIFGSITGETLFNEFMKYNDNDVCAAFVFWHCLLTEAEQDIIVEYAHQYRENFLK